MGTLPEGRVPATWWLQGEVTELAWAKESAPLTVFCLYSLHGEQDDGHPVRHKGEGVTMSGSALGEQGKRRKKGVSRPEGTFGKIL